MASIIVVGGTAGLGSFVVKELAASKNFSPVRVLSRADSNQGSYTPPEGVELCSADYNDHASLMTIFKGVDIVLSVVGTAGVPSQVGLIEAAKEAGVKRFVPSEFGVDPSKLPPYDFYKPKIEIQNVLKGSGLEYILYGVGLFTDHDIAPWFGFDFANNTVKIVGEGNMPASWTWRSDVAKFVAQTIARPEHKNQVVNYEGDVKSLNEVAMLAELSGKSGVNVTHVPKDKALADAKAFGNFAAVAVTEIAIAAEEGYAKVTDPRKVVPGKSVDEWFRNQTF